MMRGMEYLTDRPGCEFPELVKINRWWKPDRRVIRSREPRKRSNNRRSSMDKTGQWTRTKQRQDIVSRYGNLCHICLANGITDQRAVIDLTIPWPHEDCFTRDHMIPRSQGGPDTLENLRPAHHRCNRDRGDGPVIMIREVAA
jgi:5-methylcytosine-specific restriction endonuclease McrA